jgi:hypothetical protein
MPDAFKHQAGVTVPLVWQHGHSAPENILGHAVLQNRDGSVYAYGFFNNTPSGQQAKALVEHQDIKALSIHANKLVEKSKQVFHGMITEVSLVLSGANPGAVIDNVSIRHADGDITELDDEAIIFTGLALEHEDLSDDVEEEEIEHAGDMTIQDVYDSMSEDQKAVVNYMVGAAIETAGASHSDDSESGVTAEDNDKEGDLNHQEGNKDMTHNVFDQTDADSGGKTGSTLTHAQLTTLVADGHKLGSLKESVLAHAEDYGITNIEILFPDAQAIDNKPEWITRRMEWVETVLNGTRKLPFSKIKSLSADLTHEEARAKGYIKANMKKEQFFSIAKRETGPKTIYKKQKLDRDDIIDITEFDVVAWIWVEMRFMLREEIARAVLIGDGREVDDDDKIDEDKIRPIATDNSFYTDVVVVAANIAPDAIVEAVVRARDNYKGAGNPTMFTYRSVLNDMLLLKDGMGRRLYRNRAELAAELEVSDIVEVPVMEDATTDDGDLIMILVNLSDYSIGSTRGGEITTFDDFDIDFNQYKYLIEGRMSGALTKHKTAQVVVRTAGTLATPAVPTFVPATGVVTIPTVTGVIYKNQGTGATLSAGAQTAIPSLTTINIVAVPAATYHFPHNFDADWAFTRTT